MKKRVISLLVCVAMVFTIVYNPMLVEKASAVTNPYPQTQNVDKDPYYEIPCTRFAWQQVYDNAGIALPKWGDAVEWWQGAKNSGYETGSTPQAGAIAVWEGDKFGHVAYVTSGSGNTFTVNEGGRTDLDHTSSHGVDYGYTLTNVVGEKRSGDSGKTLLGFIYPTGSEKPTLSVTIGNSATATKISWTKGKSAKTYNLRIKKHNGSAYKTYKDVWGMTSTSYSLTLPAGKYSVYVDACNGSKYYASNTATFTIQEGVGKPTLSVTAGDTDTKSKISWTKAKNAKTYNLRIKKKDGSAYKTYKDVWGTTDTSYSIKLPAGDYSVYVDACNGSKYAASNTVKFTVKAPTVGKPTLSVKAGDSKSATKITWTKGTNAKTYNLRIKKKDGSSYKTYKDVWGMTTKSYSVKLPAGDYSVYVDACNGSKYVASNTVKFTVSSVNFKVDEDTCSHSWNNGSITKQSTCTTEGEKTYTCQLCGTKKTEKVAKKDHTEVDLPGKEATTTETGLTVGKKCSVCQTILVKQEVIEKLPESTDTPEETPEYTPEECPEHTFGNWTVDEKATFDEYGWRVAVCSACGEEDWEIIPQAGKVKLSTTAYVYNGKVKNPTVKVTDEYGDVISSKNYTVKKLTARKAVGKHSYKITFKNEYKGTKTVSFKINPKATSLTKKPTAVKKGFTAKWKKISTQATGYEIMYSTSKNFTKSTSKTVKVKSYKTTSKKITGLKSKKTYYVRVRTYKTVSGVNYTSAWSGYKTVKTK